MSVNCEKRPRHEGNLADYNLDGVVKYNGSANDRNVLLGNMGIATPSAVVRDQTEC